MDTEKKTQATAERVQAYQEEIQMNKEQAGEQAREPKASARGGRKHLPQERSLDAIGDFVGQRIEEAMRGGAFDNLPGRGKPLNLRQNDHVPKEMQMAFNLLEDNNLIPAWITRRQDVFNDIEQLREALRTFSDWYQAESEAATDEVTRQALAAKCSQAKAEWGKEVVGINRRILDLNLTQPLDQLEVMRLRVEDEFRRAGL